MLRPNLAKLITISIPAGAVAVTVLGLLIEMWVRYSWDPLRGSPWFYSSSVSRLKRLTPNYSGWFAGVPVRTNSLGFRDPREYSLDKGPNTFRIAFFGDSVTYGWGALYETTTAYLLETKLKAQMASIDWQVWNLGVPGYNTRQELTYLQEVGPAYEPDLVVVGFHENDVLGNLPVRSPARATTFMERVENFLRTHFLSYHLYRKVYLQAYLTFFSSDYHRHLLKIMAQEATLFSRLDEVVNLEEQKLTPFERLPSDHRVESQCYDRRELRLIEEIRHMASWHTAVDEFQRLHLDGTYRIVFLLNMAPDVCERDDSFFDGQQKRLNEYFLEVLSDGGVPIVSSYDAFLPYRPSQMPLAGGHSLGNANLLKAEILFEYLKTRVFPEIAGPNYEEDGLADRIR